MDRGGEGVCTRIARGFQLYENSHLKSSPERNYGMNLKGNHSQLTPFKKGDPRAKECALKSAKKRSENYAKRRAIKEDLDVLLKLTIKKGELASVDDVLSLEEAQDMNVSVQTAMDIAMVQRALLGDTQAYLAIRDTIGEKPSDKVELDQSLTIESWAKNHDVKL